MSAHPLGYGRKGKERPGDPGTGFDPGDVGRDLVPQLQGYGLGAAGLATDFQGSQGPLDRIVQDNDRDRIRRARAIKGTDSDDPALNPKQTR